MSTPPKSASRSWPPIRSRNASDGGPLVQLPDGYRDRANEIGKLRVVQGGYRTAEFFKGL